MAICTAIRTNARDREWEREWEQIERKIKFEKEIGLLDWRETTNSIRSAATGLTTSTANTGSAYSSSGCITVDNYTGTVFFKAPQSGTLTATDTADPRYKEPWYRQAAGAAPLKKASIRQKLQLEIDAWLAPIK